MYYKKLKQGMMNLKNVRKSSVMTRPHEVLTTTQPNTHAQRKSYDGFGKISKLNSETSSVTSCDKENISENLTAKQTYTKNDPEIKVRRLMKQRESMLKVRSLLCNQIGT
jgi:hypothetical protein